MHKTTIYLDDEVYERLKILADSRGRTQASIIREALAGYVSPRRRQPRSIGLGASAIRDLSERSEELLEGMGRDGHRR